MSERTGVDPDLSHGEQHPAIYWRPDDTAREHPINGLFWLSDSGLPMVQLHESITPGLSGMFTTSETPQLMHARIMGEHVTLTNLTLVSSKQNLIQDDVALIRYSARWAFVGEYWLEDIDEDKVFDQFRVRFRHQDLWAGFNPVRLNMATPEIAASIEHLRPDPVVFPCKNATWELRDATTFNWTEMKPSSKFHICLERTATLQEMIAEWIVPLQFVLVSAVAQYCAIEFLSVRNTKLKLHGTSDGDDDPPSASWLRVYSSQRDSPAKEVHGALMLHRYSDFPKEYDFDVVLDTARHNRFAIDQYLNIKAGLTGGYLTTFVAAAQAVEALDRVAYPDVPVGDEKWWETTTREVLRALKAPSKIVSAASYGARISFRPTLAARLKRVDADTGGVVSKIFGSRRWADDLAAARNVVAHGLENTELLKTDVRGVQTATEAYLLLFELRWLTLIGFSPERAEELSSRRGYYWDTVRRLQDGAEQIRLLATRATR